MPVHKISGGYQYGQTGKKYYGEDAKRKAELQGRAIKVSQAQLKVEKYRAATPNGSLQERYMKIGKAFMNALLKRTVD